MKFRWIFFLVIFCCAKNVSAQDNLIFSDEIFPTENIEKQTALLKNLFPQMADEEITFTLRHFNKSPYSKHYTFNVLYNNFPVFTNFVKVNVDNSHKIISIASHLYEPTNFSKARFAAEEKSWKQQTHPVFIWPKDQEVKEQYLAIYEYENQAHIVSVQNAWDKTYDFTKIINLNNEVIAEWNHQRKLGIDTFINANVFIPDPLTFLNQIYGGLYVDANDADQPWMSTAYFPVNIPAVYDNLVNKFFIENDYVKMTDIQPPTIPASSSTNNNFYFNRSQPGFEECNAAYHITKFHNYLTTLGYDTLMDLQLDVDAHGQFGADNSVFNRNGGVPNIIFGDGGVDDAEDADVIIHEYSHGLSWSANQNSFLGDERDALDEGLCDYFATSYSRGLSNFGWQNVFNWDGHNQYWSGRTAVTLANYSKPFSGNFYELGEVWNAALQNIYTDLGHTTTDALMCETLFFLTDYSNLPSAAYYFLQADDLLNGGVNKPIICQHFRNKNLLSSDCYPTSTKDVANENLFTVKNSLGFSQGTGDVVIDINQHQPMQVQLFDMNGRMLFDKKIIGTSIVLSPSNYNSGIYILKIQSKKNTHTVKLSRW